jgi:hypothetical protein
MYRFRDVSIESTEVDAMVVLGRGINEQGELSQTGYDRARAAAHLTYLMSNGPLRTVVNTGGRSWKQVLAGQMPPRQRRGNGCRDVGHLQRRVWTLAGTYRPRR